MTIWQLGQRHQGAEHEVRLGGRVMWQQPDLDAWVHAIQERSVALDLALALAFSLKYGSPHSRRQLAHGADQDGSQGVVAHDVNGP